MIVRKFLGKLTSANDFRVITVGTGAPHYDTQRASACTLVQFRDTAVIVDLGYRSVSRMMDAGINAFEIPNVMFTHCLHLDHTLDYGYFMCLGNDSKQPLNLYGPPGTKRLHDSIYSLYAAQIGIKAPNMTPREINIEQIGDGMRFRIGQIEVQTQEVAHIVQNLAYKFSAGGKTVVVPGDMSMDEGFISFAKDADLIVFDTNTAPSAFMDEMAEKMRARDVPYDPMRKPGGDAHASLEEIGDMATRANAKAIVLTHFTRGPKIEETVKRIASIYPGEIIVGEDMLAVEL